MASSFSCGDGRCWPWATWPQAAPVPNWHLSVEIKINSGGFLSWSWDDIFSKINSREILTWMTWFLGWLYHCKPSVATMAPNFSKLVSKFRKLVSKQIYALTPRKYSQTPQKHALTSWKYAQTSRKYFTGILLRDFWTIFGFMPHPTRRGFTMILIFVATWRVLFAKKAHNRLQWFFCKEVILQ